MAKTTNTRRRVPVPSAAAVPAAQTVVSPPPADSPWACETFDALVLEEESSFAADNSKATVIIEHRGDNFPVAIDELTSTETRNLAIAYASAAGVGDARLNGNLEGPYAVNMEGTPIEEVRGPDGKPLPPRHPLMQPARYRVAVPICRKLV